MVGKETLHLLKPSWLKWKKEWTGCVLIVLALRIFYSIVGFWVVSSGGPIPLNETIYGMMKPYLQNSYFSKYFLAPWFQWDTLSYLKIAILGYERDATVAFMPLYPILIRFFGMFFDGNYLLSALVVSTICAMIALILLGELFQNYFPGDVAWRAVLMFVCFPTAFFLLAGYTESLFLIFVLAFWLLAWQRKWLLAGLFAGLATLTRLQGVVLSAVMIWMLLVSLLEQPSANPIWQVREVFSLFRTGLVKKLANLGMVPWLAVLIPPLVAAGYQAWLKSAGYGTIAGALRTYWRLETVAPWTGFILFLQRLPTRHFNYMDWIDLALLILVLIAAILGLRRLDPAFSIYVWLTLAVLFTRGTPPHLLASFSRYFLGLFPLFLYCLL